MKTIKQVEQDIANAERSVHSAITSGEEKKLLTQIATYRQVKLYLEAGVTEESLKGQLRTLKDRLKKLEDEYDPSSYALMGMDSDVKKGSKYNQIHDIPGLKKSIENLEYILS